MAAPVRATMGHDDKEIAGVRSLAAMPAMQSIGEHDASDEGEIWDTRLVLERFGKLR